MRLNTISKTLAAITAGTCAWIGSAVAAPSAGNQATPAKTIKAPKGFQVELLYSVPGDKEGSWVNLCTDDKGRIIVSDQYGGLYRFKAPAPHQKLQASDIETVPAKIRAVNGMVWYQGALYVGVNDYQRQIDSGLYRVSDSNGDDKLDKVEKLRAMEARGDHGVHAVVPAPDGKSLFLVTGNSTTPTQFDHSKVPVVWGEDHLLPRMPDGRGHNRGVLAPGGIIYQVSPDGKDWTVYSSGYRNIFDAAFNVDGELFTYDADMEYDFNTPWYRPTRICLVSSGSEYGWRNGTGKRFEWLPDNLPAVHNIGPGSPTGVLFGYGAKFPARYQNALYALDWSWGKLYAVHLNADGSSYSGKKEEFLSGAPLPLTDAIIHPEDGAMYFAIGGRKVQSGLYRVTYHGEESTTLATRKATSTPERKLRHQLEAFHGKVDPKAVDASWPYLDHSDRFVRWAARTAIEHQPMDTWAERALKEKNGGKRVEALMGLARVGGADPFHRKEGHQVDKKLGNRILRSLSQVDWSSLNHEQQLTLVRAEQLALNRFDGAAPAVRKALLAQLEPQFPAPTFELNTVLCETLAYLQSETVAAAAIALMEAAPAQEEQMEYARSLRMLKAGWTPKLRETYFNWFLKAASYRGGASFSKFIEFIRNDAVASLSDAEKASMKELLAKQPEQKSPLEILAEALAGRGLVKEWTLEELAQEAEKGLKGRSFENGRKMFGAAGCFACHRFGNQGGMNGPDLTGAGGRYSARDFLDQVIDPSKEINEQFVPVVLTKKDNTTVTGVIVNLNGDTVQLNTDLTDPNQRVGVNRNEVVSIETSTVSPMPEGLLNMLNKQEIMDLLAYVLSGGKKDHAFFSKR